MNKNRRDTISSSDSPIDEHYLEHHFVQKGVLTPEETMKPMVAHLRPDELSPEKIFQAIEPHGQMAKTLYQTELAHEELLDMDLSDAGGEEDQ